VLSIRLLQYGCNALARGQTEPSKTANGPEIIMNHFSVETSAFQAQTTDLQALDATQGEDAIAELNLSQLMLVGGGTGIAVLV
jgi:hypothetical protein